MRDRLREFFPFFFLNFFQIFLLFSFANFFWGSYITPNFERENTQMQNTYAEPGMTVTLVLLSDSKVHLITRRVSVDITGSLQQFAKSGHDAVSWSPTNTKIGEILGVSDVFDRTLDDGQTPECLQNAVLHKFVCLDHKNDFPIDLDVTISCIPVEETTRYGNKLTNCR